MSMSSKAPGTVAVAPSQATVKFFGRSCDVSHKEPVYVQAMGQLVAVTNELKGIAHKDDSWNSLSMEMSHLSNHFMNPDSNIKRFQLELATEGLLPYLKKLNGRLHFDKKRFHQINTIIHAITSTDNSHPALTLQSLDEVILDLKRNKTYLFKSELLTLLETATEKQWQPIIVDNRNILQNVGGKFLIVGLVGVVGWPLAFMYPLYRVALNMARIASEYEQNKRITMESGIEVAKTLAIIFAATQLLSILSVYAALGHFCLACGVLAIAISANRAWIKQLAPVMAPHVVQLDQVLTLIGSIDHSKLTNLMMNKAQVAAGSSGSDGGFSTTSNNEFVTSSRVEELPSVASSKENVSFKSTASAKLSFKSTSGSSKSSDYSDMDGDELMDVIDNDEDIDVAITTLTSIDESGEFVVDSSSSFMRKRK